MKIQGRRRAALLYYLELGLLFALWLLLRIKQSVQYYRAALQFSA